MTTAQQERARRIVDRTAEFLTAWPDATVEQCLRAALYEDVILYGIDVDAPTPRGIRGSGLAP